MEEKILTELRKEAELSINKLGNYDQIDNEYGKILSHAQKEIGIVNELDKFNNNISNQSERVEFEKAKFKKEFSLRKKEYELNEVKEHNEYLINCSKMDIEKEKLNFEKDKLEFEKMKYFEDSRRSEEDAKKKKIDRLIDISLRVLEIGLPLFVNAGLVLMNFRLIYKDDGRTPSELKDLMRNVYKK